MSATTVTILVTIESDDHATTVTDQVDNLLDGGAVQDCFADAELHVTSILIPYAGATEL